MLLTKKVSSLNTICVPLNSFDFLAQWTTRSQPSLTNHPNCLEHLTDITNQYFNLLPTPPQAENLRLGGSNSRNKLDSEIELRWYKFIKNSITLKSSRRRLEFSHLRPQPVCINIHAACIIEIRHFWNAKGLAGLKLRACDCCEDWKSA